MESCDEDKLAGVKRWGTKDGTYGFLKKIGEGTFGMVYLAERGKFQPVVAVTLLDTEKTGGSIGLEPFEAMMGFSHNNIVTIIDCYLCYDPPGSSMRRKKLPVAVGLVARHRVTRNLSKYLQCYHIGETTRLRWYQQLLQGLDYLHNSIMICHGDINPQNVWIEDDNLKLAYGGVAEAAWKAKSPNSSFGEFMSEFDSSAPFLSPEAWYSKPIYNTSTDMSHMKTSDIFSLGLTFLTIAEAPDKGFHYGNWNNEKIFMGKLLYEQIPSRSASPTHLIWPPMSNCGPHETKIINRMLQFNMQHRPDVRVLIQDFNTAAGKMKSRQSIFEYGSNNSWSASLCSC